MWSESVSISSSMSDIRRVVHSHTCKYKFYNKFIPVFHNREKKEKGLLGRRLEHNLNFLWIKYFIVNYVILLFINLCRKQRKLEEQYGEGNCNERTLFHGTTPDLAKVIEHQNLDPRIYGTNGTVYGKGTYFAVEASYSDNYASTNKDGHKFMFMASVLTGKFCIGDTSYTRPPPIDTSNKYSPLYDSCVDNIKNPSMYCIFHDSQFYIDYLIEYM